MKRPLSSFALAGAAAFALSGCARIPGGAAAREKAPDAGGIGLQPGNSETPAEAAAWMPAPPQPVYRNPKIGVVYLRAYQDAQGRLFGPQVMYQVSDPGGWNVEAAQQNGGYISATNLDAPPAAHAESPLMKPELAARITLTGLMQRGDRAEAEALAAKAGGGWTAAFDEQAGWILLPP